jgi:PAS domain S-box-containing protein
MAAHPSEPYQTSAQSERLAELLTLSYEPMFIWRVDGTIENWNGLAEQLYGFSREEAVGRISHALLKTKFPIEIAELSSRLRRDRHWSGELRHTCKNGHEVVVDSRMQLLGESTILEVNRDITELKELISRQAALARELTATAAKFEALFNQSGLFAGIVDMQGYLREANNLSLEWCGYTRADVLNHLFWETPWWRGSEEVKARIRLATKEAASGSIFREELRYWLADGRERIVDFAMHPIRDPGGSVMYLHPTGIDITDRKQAEAALRESDQRLRWIASVVESSDDAIVSKNLDGIITSWNSGAERLFDYKAEEVIGQPITILIPQHRQDEESMILSRIRRGEHIDHYETVRQRKHGETVVVSLTISPIKDAEGAIVGASKIARDITEQKRSQEQIAVLAREAEHRSKNVLANVQAIVSLSKGETPKRLKAVIEGRIRALSNVHSLFVETRWIGAELSDIAAQELAPYLDDHDTRIRFEGPKILLEPNAAQAIAVTLHELATNAVKYGALSDSAGKIELRWAQGQGGEVRLVWTEVGGPSVRRPERRGFGSRLIERTLSQFNGVARFDWRSDGLLCELTLHDVKSDRGLEPDGPYSV